MSTKIQFDTDSFVTEFIRPLSKVSDKTSIYVTKNKIYSLVSNKESGTILYAVYDKPQEIDNEIRLNFSDIGKFGMALQTLKNNQITDCTMLYGGNFIEFKSPKIKFKYFLIDDIIMPPLKIKPEKIESLPFDSEFNITTSELKEINKGIAFAADVGKCYFFCKDGNVHCAIDDRTLTHANTYETVIAENIAKPFEETFIIKKDFMLFLNDAKIEKINIRINEQFKVMQFRLESDTVKLCYNVQTSVK